MYFKYDVDSQYSSLCSQRQSLLDADELNQNATEKFIRFCNEDCTNTVNIQWEISKMCQAQSMFMRLLIDVKGDDTIQFLQSKIIDNISTNYDMFKDLNNLCVVDLKARNDNNKLLQLNEGDIISEVLWEEDVVEFDLTSQDVWIKMLITLYHGEKFHRCYYEVRVSRDLTILDFRKYIYKSVITLWNQLKIHNHKDVTFYFLDSVKIYSPVFRSSTQNLESIRDSSHRPDNSSSTHRQSNESVFTKQTLTKNEMGSSFGGKINYRFVSILHS